MRQILHAISLLIFLCAFATTSIAADWPQWRGPDRTDISTETNLLEQWPADGPERVWLYRDAGLGYSGFSVADGRLFTMGARGNREYVIALDAVKGTELWAVPISDVLDNGWGDGPRGTPTVDGDRVYALSGTGALVCANVKNGEVIWKKTMSELGGRTPNWGYAESVLVDDGKVICTPGGNKGAIAALDKMTGRVIWQSKEFTDGAQYSSVIIATPHESKQYVQLTMKNLVGVDPDSGKMLWKSSWPGRTAVIPTPIYHDDSVYIASGYNVGCKRVQIDPRNNVEAIFENKVMINHHGGVILYEGHFYGYSDGDGWTCQDFKTGEAKWSERRKLKKGAIACADGKMYLLEEGTGTVVLIDATPSGWNERGRFTLSPQTEQRSPRGRIWTHPVISNGRLYLRDQEIIYCFDIKAD